MTTLARTAPTRRRRPAASRGLAQLLAGVPREPLLLIWTLFVLLDPIYVFKSGVPQPADLLILMMAPFVLARWNGRLAAKSRRAVRSLLLFVGYVVLNALVWSLVAGTWTLNPKYGFLITPLFYVFDAMAFVVILAMYERFGERFVWLTVRMILISLGIQILLTFIYTRGGQFRSYGLFNSSNQLGYYSILCASILLIGQLRFRIAPLYVIAGQLGCLYLALLSASRAALASAAILIAVAVINRFRTVIVIAVLGLFFALVANPFEAAMERSRTRIETDQSLGVLEERGYDRLAAHPEYLLLGAGEGYYQRFKETSALGSHELHSSAGTLVFCYGVVGTSLFLGFLWQVLRGASLRRFLLLLPPAAYGLSHQGLRFTMFWVLLALVVMFNDLDQRDRARARSIRNEVPA